MTSAFERETAVERVTHGRYRAHFTDAWCAPVVPQGGLATATAAQAMAAELDCPEMRLRSITTVYAAPVRVGLAEIEVDVIRRGRSIAQCSATMRSPGEDAGHASVAVFGAPRDGFDFTDVARPEVRPPHECPSFRDPGPEGVDKTFTFWDRIEGRPANGHPYWEDWVATSSERINWYRFDDPPMLADGRMDPLALVTLCDTMPGAVGERMGGGMPQWLPPSADITVHLLGDVRSEWVLARNRARHSGGGYASVEMELWDPAGGLAAYATQIMFFTFPDGPPSAEQRIPRDLRR